MTLNFKEKCLVILGELKFIVVDNDMKVETLLKGVQDSKYSIETLILMKEAAPSIKQKCTAAGVEILSFKEVCALGKSALKAFVVRF